MAHKIESNPITTPWHGMTSFYEKMVSQPKPTVEQALELGSIDYNPIGK